jgi:hypothetical protein
VKEVKNIHARDQWKKWKRRQKKEHTAMHHLVLNV